MRLFEVSIKGASKGYFHGMTADAALNEYAQKRGYPSYSSLCWVTGDDATDEIIREIAFVSELRTIWTTARLLADEGAEAVSEHDLVWKEYFVITKPDDLKLTAGRLFDKMTSHLDSNGVAGFYQVMVIDYTDSEKGVDLRVENHEIDGHRYEDDFPDDS